MVLNYIIQGYMENSLKLRECIDQLREAQEAMNSRVTVLTGQTGKIIEEQDITRTIESLLKVSRCQSNCLNEYKALFSQDNAPDTLEALQAKADEYDAMVAQLAERQEALRVIERFDSIRSSAEQFTVLLESASKELHSIDAALPLDEYREKTARFDKFYDAVCDQDIHSRVEKSISLTPLFDQGLVLALVQGMLYADVPASEKKIPAMTAASSVGSSCVSARTDDIPAETASEQPPEQNFAPAAETVSEPAPVPESAESAATNADRPAESDHPDKITEEDLKLMDKLRSMGILFDQAEPRYGKVEVEHGNETPVDSVKTFRKDMEKLSSGNAFGIVCLSEQNIITKRELEDHKHLNGKRIDFTYILASLLEKGYIRKHTLPERGEYYAITEKLINALRLKGALNAVTAKFHNAPNSVLVSDYHHSTIEEADLTCTAATALSIDEIQCSWMDLSGMLNMSSHSRCCFALVMQHTEKKSAPCVIAAGAFLTSDFTVREFQKTLINDFEKYPDCRGLVLASYNADQCRRLREYVVSLKDGVDKLPAIFYSFDDNSYFDPDGNPVKLSDMYDLLKSPAKEEAPAGDIITAPSAVSVEAQEVSVPAITEPAESPVQANADPAPAHEEAPAPTEPAPLTSAPEAPEIPESPAPELSDEKAAKASAAVQPHHRRISYDEARSTAIRMLADRKPYCALAFLKAAGETNADTANLYKYLAYAYNDPMEDIRYSSNLLIEFVNDDIYQNDDFAKSLIRTAALRNFFSNDTEYDYMMKPLNDTVMSCSIPEVKWLANELMTSKKKRQKGLDIFCEYYNKSHISLQNQIDQVCTRAKNYYDQYIRTPYSIEIKMKRFMDTYTLIFKSKNSDLAECLKIVSDNETDQLELVDMFLRSLTDSQDISSISVDDVNSFITKKWDECCENDVIHKSTPLVSDLRRKIFSRVNRCVITLCDWVKLTKIYKSGRDISPIAGKEKSEYLEKLSSAIEACNGSINAGGEGSAEYISLKDALEEFRAKIDGSWKPSGREFFYINFLKGQDIVLYRGDNNMIFPDLRDYCYNIDGLDIFSRIIHHAENEAAEFPTADELDDVSSAEHITRYLESCSTDSTDYAAAYTMAQDPSVKGQRDTFIKKKLGSFVEYLELAQSYGKFDMTSDNNIKDNLLNQANDLLAVTRRTGNYGFFIRMISGIKEYVEKNARNQEPAIRQRLDKLHEKYTDDSADAELLQKNFETIEEFIRVQNYTAAEDLINRTSNGDLYTSSDRYSPDLLTDFHNQYSSIYSKCNNIAVTLAQLPEISRYIKNTAVARKDEKSGLTLIDVWLTQNFNPQKTEKLLSMLGIDADVTGVKGAESFTSRIPAYYECKLKYADEIHTKYPHIFAPFGSKGSRKTFRVVCLYGTNNCDRILKEIDAISRYNKDTIIFVDYAYQEADRGRLARELKKRRSNEIYMVVDRVLITYLAAHYQKTSIASTLMNLAMPYSYYQPYVPDSMNYMPPEMFIGRSRELNDIKSEKGVHMLYGGRQLGKSALLKKAQLEIDHNGDARAVYVDLKNAGVEESALRISEELSQKKIFDQTESYTDWNALCNAIRRAIRRSSIGYLLLLLDEGDAFIDDCKECRYQPIDRLKSVMDDTEVSFKFVIAGLHNLVRYDHESSTKDNSVIPHLRTLTIKPFTYSEARDLLQYPLSSLGIYFRDDEKNQALISTILATTNYFPGLIQFYCSQLVDSLCRDDCPCYAGSNLPPYYVSETQIQKILANEDFTAKIKEKFNITLALDKDNYYEILALSLAYLCLDQGIGIGYTSKEILSNIQEFNISKVSNLSIERISMLMDELVDLNIFRETDAGRYVFSRQNFMQLMGTQDEIFEALCGYGSDNTEVKR